MHFLKYFHKARRSWSGIFNNCYSIQCYKNTYQKSGTPKKISIAIRWKQAACQLVHTTRVWFSWESL